MVVVVPVIRSQLSVIRTYFLLISYALLQGVVILVTTFLIPDDRLLITSQAHARDLGTHGVLHPIAEEDPIALIQQKLKKMEEKGELEKHHLHIQKQTKESVERPGPVKGISQAKKNRRFTYDPTFTVAKDIKDHRGRVIHPKGAKINPLETVTMTEELVFIDGDDFSQKQWAFERIQKSEGSHQKENKTRLILVKGAPLSLSEEFHVPVYFDQGGVLVKKLGIKYVPAIVSQNKSKDKGSKDLLFLQIEEICLSDSSSDKKEANKGGEK